MKYRTFEEFQNYFLNLAMILATVQEEMPPELFSPLADAFLSEYKQALKLFNIENDVKFDQKQSKYRFKLLKKGWKKKIRDELFPKTSGVVKGKRQSEPKGSRIKSEAVYADALDNVASLQLEAQVEPDKASTGLIAFSASEDVPIGGSEKALPTAPGQSSQKPLN